MKHYLTEEEFTELLMSQKPGLPCEYSVACENMEGETEYIRFREEVFLCENIILYCSDYTCGVGLIQDDAFGFEDRIHSLWEDITEQWEIKPYIERESQNDNLF